VGLSLLDINHNTVQVSILTTNH